MNVSNRFRDKYFKMGFLGGIVVKNPPANEEDARDRGYIPRLGRSPGEGISYPLQYSWTSPCGSAGKESAYIV